MLLHQPQHVWCLVCGLVCCCIMVFVVSCCVDFQ